MASRAISDLHPLLRPVAKEFLERCAKAGLGVNIYCTYRSNQEQAELYASGRSRKGPILTNARPGESKHNFVLKNKPASKAFDACPSIGGKYIWDEKHPFYAKMGAIGESLGLKWYGAKNSRFKEFVHFEKNV